MTSTLFRLIKDKLTAVGPSRCILFPFIVIMFPVYTLGTWALVCVHPAIRVLAYFGALIVGSSIGVLAYLSAPFVGFMRRGCCTYPVRIVERYNLAHCSRNVL